MSAYDLRCPECGEVGAMRAKAPDMLNVFQCLSCARMFVKEGVPMHEDKEQIDPLIYERWNKIDPDGPEENEPYNADL